VIQDLIYERRPVSKSSAQIRQEFLDFFEQRGHAIVPGGPVVPHDDPTLMFTNAGMNQFKDVFLGSGSRNYMRAVDTQPCLRAGGKHNDLDEVGHDTYHHTLFEMLGNWSFGDYFKREAIQWAWELLTGVWGLDKDRLYATYFGGEGARAQGAGRVEDLPCRQAGVAAAPRGGRRESVDPDGESDSGMEPDLEARDLWLEVTDIDPSHVMPFGAKDNFWEMGDTGPCGPCSEIHIDLTPDKSGGPLVNAGDPRVMEIWNLVFIQYNRALGGKLSPLPARHVDTGMGFERITAVLQGMAAGRLGELSNYDTDVFTPIFDAIREATGAPEYTGLLEEGPRGQGAEGSRGQGAEGSRGQGAEGSRGQWAEGPRGQGAEGARGQGAEGPEGASARSSSAPGPLDPSAPAVMADISYRVIADHIRALVFAMADGALPDRDGRGYVLRRILRRAVRYGWQYMNVHKPFLCDLVPAVVESMGEAFAKLREHAGRIAGVIREEEESFGRTLDRGIELFEQAAERGAISGEDAFKLHDTFGFPIDLTQVMAAERDLDVDIAKYKQLMQEARDRARAGGLVTTDELLDSVQLNDLPERIRTDDSRKYHAPPKCDSTVAYMVHDGREAVILTERTPFYVEQGGQAADVGTIRTATGTLRVQFVKRIERGVILHKGVIEAGEIDPKQSCTLEVDLAHRHPTMQNHTATHILNWALRETLGDHVQQKGSLVDPEKTRFDFSNPKSLTADELAQIESLCAEQIAQDLEVHTNNNEPVSQAEAMKINGLRAVFGEKYPEQVRVVSIGAPVADLLSNPDNPEWRKYSIEFCGGTHVSRTSEIVCFSLVAEEAVAKGVRRLVGISGDAAREAVANGERLIKHAQQLLEGSRLETGSTDGAAEAQWREGLTELQRALAEETIPVTARAKLRDAISELQKAAKQQQKQAASLSADVVKQRIEGMIADAPKVGDTTIVVGEMPDVPVDQLKTGADIVKQKCGSAAILLGAAGEKALLLAAMTDDLVKRGLKAGDLVKEAAKLVKGGGGGPPTMAQAGGKDPSKLGAALEAGRAWIAQRLG
jgi:alanyl-tRNA synthetase